MIGAIMYFKNAIRKKEYVSDIENVSKKISRRFFFSEKDICNINFYIYFKDEKINIVMYAESNIMNNEKSEVLESSEYILRNTGEDERWNIYQIVLMLLCNISSLKKIDEDIEQMSIKMSFDEVEKYLMEYDDLINNSANSNKMLRYANFFEISIPFENMQKDFKMNSDYELKMQSVLKNSFLSNVLKADRFLQNLREMLLVNKLTEKEDTNKVKRKI